MGNMVCCRHFKSLEGRMMSMFLALMNIIWPFGFGTVVSASSSKIWAIFVQSSGHPDHCATTTRLVIVTYCFAH